jgi:hypothetical protein
MARPRGYQEAYGNEALHQLRAWAELTPADLSEFVRASGGKLSAQHVRNIESRGKNRIFPSEGLLDQILMALHSDRETLERVRTDIAAQHAYENTHPAVGAGAGAGVAPTNTLYAALAAQDTDQLYAPTQAHGLAPGTWSAAVDGATPASAPAPAPASAPAKSLFGSAPLFRSALTAPRNQRRARSLATQDFAEPAGADSLPERARSSARTARMPVQAPSAPTLSDAVREFSTIYVELDNAERLRLLGHARRVQMQQSSRPPQ